MIQGTVSVVNDNHWINIANLIQMQSLHWKSIKQMFETRCKCPPEGSDSSPLSNFVLSRFPELWNDGLHSRKNKKKDPFCPVKKKKPVVVSDILFPFVPSLSHYSHHSSATSCEDVFPPLLCIFFLNRSFTALYRLHAARSGYSWRLDRNTEGIFVNGRWNLLASVLELRVDLSRLFPLPPHRRWHRWGHTGWRWTVRVFSSSLVTVNIWLSAAIDLQSHRRSRFNTLS